VQMVQGAFGRLQADAAKDIEENVEAFSSSELHQMLSDEIGAIAEKIRPKPSEEAPAAEELQQQIAAEIGAIADMIRPEIAPIVEAPVVEELQQQIAEEIGAIADMIRPEIAPVVEAPAAEDLLQQLADELADSSSKRPVVAPANVVVTPLEAPAPEAAN